MLIQIAFTCSSCDLHIMASQGISAIGSRLKICVLKRANMLPQWQHSSAPASLSSSSPLLSRHLLFHDPNSVLTLFQRNIWVGSKEPIFSQFGICPFFFFFLLLLRHNIATLNFHKLNNFYDTSMNSGRQNILLWSFIFFNMHRVQKV